MPNYGAEILTSSFSRHHLRELLRDCYCLANTLLFVEEGPPQQVDANCFARVGVGKDSKAITFFVQTSFTSSAEQKENGNLEKSEISSVLLPPLKNDAIKLRKGN